MRPRRSVEHGQYGFARRERCRCEACLAAVSRYQKRRTYDDARGVSRRVDAAPVREHLQRFLDAGITRRQISNATAGKVSPQQVKSLMQGNPLTGKPVTWLAPHTAQALLAVTRNKVDDRYMRVPSIGVHRRIEALRWMGYTVPDLAKRLGVSYTAVYHYTERDQVTTETVRAVSKLYDQLSMTHGPDERERWRAYRKGWLPPMVWDEETIDDPDAEPDMSILACVVGHCGRSVFRLSLCRSHYWAVSKAGGVTHAQTYRRVVNKISRDPAWKEDVA